MKGNETVTYRMAKEENGTSPLLQLWYKLAICSMFIVFYRGPIPPLVFPSAKYESLLSGIG